MDSFLSPEEAFTMEPDSSAARQGDWQLLPVAEARSVLEQLPPRAPVLLVTPDELARAVGVGGVDWESTFARSLLARIQPGAVAEVLQGPSELELQPSARLVFCGGRELQLTSTEFALLQELLSRNGAVVSVDGLSSAIWGHDTLGAPNYVVAHISRLRRKLRDAGATRVIETVRGAGYCMRPPARDPRSPSVGSSKRGRHESRMDTTGLHPSTSTSLEISRNRATAPFISLTGVSRVFEVTCYKNEHISGDVDCSGTWADGYTTLLR